MTIKLGVVMDPIGSIQYKKDSTLAMLQEAKKREYLIFYFEQKDLFIRDGMAYGNAHTIDVFENEKSWHQLSSARTMPLSDLDVILMRKDPPFNEEYIYTTYILEHAAQNGVLVINRPSALRDSNEKIFITEFPKCIPPTLVTRSKTLLHEFWAEYEDIVCKPLNNMGGTSVFRLHQNDVNAEVVFDLLTQNGMVHMMAQKFIPEIKKGDKRILMIDGEPIPFALARVPQGNDWRGNLAVGAKGVVQPLTAQDEFICKEVGKTLRERGLYFVGLDVIGDYLTEINVTSPTGIREIDHGAKINISAQFFNWIENIIKAS